MTVDDLEREIADLGIRRDWVRITEGDRSLDVQYCIVPVPGGWEVFYQERGEKIELRFFALEGSACQRLLDLLRENREYLR